MTRKERLDLLATSAVMAFLVGLGLSAALVPGCATAPPEEDVVLEPIQAVQFADVPVPRDFVLIPEKSWSYETASFRLCDMTYSGRAGTQAVIDFYKEQMSARGWKLSHQAENLGVRTLNFTKGDEKCTVTVKRDGAQTILTVSIRK